MKIKCYNVLANTYSLLSQFNRVTEILQLAMNLSSRKWDNDYTMCCLSMLKSYVRLYAENNDERYADSVIHYSSQVFRNKKSDSLSWYGSTYAMLGRLYYAKKEYKKAIAYFDSSLLKKYCDADQYYYSTIKNTFRNICLVAMGDIGLGKRMLGSLPSDEYYFRKLICESLYKYFKSIKNWQQAFNYYHEYVRNNDSMQVTTTSGRLFDAEQKHAVSEKQAQITALENKNLLKEKQQNRLISAVSVTGLLLMLIIAVLTGLYRYVQVKRHSETQLLTAELYSMEASLYDERQQQQVKIAAQRQKIAEDMHDEVSSSLAAFRFYLIDLKAKAEGKETISVLAELEAEAQSLYLQAREFMRNLNASRPSDNYDVVELAKQLSGRFSNQKLLTISYDIDTNGVGCYFTPSIHYELYLVIREAVTNSIKHAGASRITIRVSFQDHQCIFSVADNGKGFRKEDITHGLGLNSISERIKKVGGKLNIISGKDGTVLHTQFPV